MKIFVSGFQHETNTFVPSRADYGEFDGGATGPILRGDALLALRDANVSMGGFVAHAQAHGYDLIPGLAAWATPSGPVTRDAFERIADEIVASARQAKADAIYLDLHGAMVAEHVDDGEGELLARLRDAVGPQTKIVASLDLHANVTARMFSCADALVAYRTYPHVDMADIGRRCGRVLERVMRGETLHRGIRRSPFLIPIEAMSTGRAPAADLYDKLRALESAFDLDLSIALGFPAADFDECGPTIWGYGPDQQVVDQALDTLFRQLCDKEADWSVSALSASDAVREAMSIAAHAVKPVVIADTHDNPGAGADGNSTEMLAALLEQRATRAAIGPLCDPAVARAAHAAGVGVTLPLTLAEGTRHALSNVFRVEAISNGECTLSGPMMSGAKLQLGPSACLVVGDVRILVTSKKVQMLDRNIYRMVGIEPERMAILVNKSSVHFRADFEPISEAVLIARTRTGSIMTDPAQLPWRRLSPGIRMSPLGHAFELASCA
ncbi:M81 family metallopeptidase [Trinickia fusca]|uniref:Microcystinase C n=1 Tax=Trinickia fusca TaxID=2419777 RepID=A0A494XGW9_9BURK|nr:M81 family metallopeptidase [Trinickia fusca]RKP47409.1 M81 family peptidase [Trinickia fusca]